VIADTSGQHARDWLEGNGPSTPRKVAAKFGHLGLFDMYSWSDHADARGIVSWLAVPQPEVHEHHKGLIVTPHRRPDFSNGMLVEIAMEVRDMAVVLARSRGGEIGNVGDLDRDIDAARERWHVPAEPSTADE
jgi:CubicO group peptidase (beta-lactamase class C family)